MKQGKSYMRQIMNATNKEEMNEVVFAAMNDYSTKISEACQCCVSDMVFVTAVLRMYLEDYEERIPDEVKPLMDALVEAAREGSTTTDIFLPHGFTK